MSLPWVSRTAYDQVCAERDRLLVEVEHVRAQLIEVATKRQTPRAERDPWPEAVTQYVNSFGTAIVRDQLKREIRIARKNGKPWEAIEAELPQEEPV